MKTKSFLKITFAIFVIYYLLRKKKNGLPVVSKVNLDKYAGLWYEIAHLPTWYQKNCYDTKAVYKKNPNGTIDVTNTCKKGSMTGKEQIAKGTAYVKDKKTKAKLQVKFQWPFKGDYWILKLGDDYEYALVGTPSRKNLWILSRKPKLDKKIVKRMIAYAEEYGFNTDQLIFTEH